MDELKFPGTKIDVPQCSDKTRQMMELEKCIKKFKKKCEREGVFKILKERQYYRKPSEIMREYRKQHSRPKKYG